MTTTTPRPRGAGAKSAARRADILAAAVEVFSSSGFHKGSLRDVADRAGLSQAGLLHHFPSKEHLVGAVLAWRDEETRSRIGEDRTGIDALRSLVELVRYNQQTPELVELHATLSAEATSPDHPAHEYFLRRYAWVVDFLCAKLQEASAEGVLRPGVDPRRAAETMVGLMDGLQVLWLYRRDTVDMKTLVAHHIQTLLTVEL